MKKYIKENHSQYKHGMYKTPVYNAWRNMKDRCYNKNTQDYKNYGGRGIKVCDRWKDSFENFYKDMGDKPFLNHSLDRIDSNGDYEPNNCRWANSLTQGNNRRNVKKYEVDGELLSLAEISRKHGVKRLTLHRRITKQGMTIEEAIKTPLIKYQLVTYDKNRNKYIVSVKREGKTHFVGRFDTKKEALKKRAEWVENYEKQRGLAPWPR